MTIVETKPSCFFNPNSNLKENRKIIIYTFQFLLTFHF